MYIDKILGMNFHSLNKSTAIKLLKLDIDTDIKHQHISITNTEAIYFGSKNLEHYNYINNSKTTLLKTEGKINLFRFSFPVI